MTDRTALSIAELSIAHVTEQLRALGVRPGGVLVVHTSFRAVRPIEDGPHGLIAALQAALGPDGTLVMPSWTGDDSTPFNPATTPASSDLGVVADTFWRLPGVRRSDHPFAFAAAGPQADDILQDPLPLPPHIKASPIGRVYDLEGQVLLLGVGHDADTAIHLAELRACVPYGVPKHITVSKDGRPLRVGYRENDHCCERFRLMDGWLREQGLQREGVVGHAEAKLCGITSIVGTASAEIAHDPMVFLHPPSHRCEECDAARASIR